MYEMLGAHLHAEVVVLEGVGDALGDLHGVLADAGLLRDDEEGSADGDGRGARARGDTHGGRVALARAERRRHHVGGHLVRKPVRVRMPVPDHALSVAWTRRKKAHAFSTGLFDWYRRRYFEVHGENSLASLLLMNSIFSQLCRLLLCSWKPPSMNTQRTTPACLLNGEYEYSVAATPGYFVVVTARTADHSRPRRGARLPRGRISR